MALSSAEQRQLLERIRDAEGRERDSAIAALIADFRGPAMAMIQRVLAGSAAGPQHAQDAWSRAVFRFLARGLDAYEGRAAPRSYFVRVAINAAIDELRRLGREQKEVELVQHETPVTLLETREEQRQLLRRIEVLQRCIEALPESTREPVRLYYLQQAGSCERCAASMGLSKGAFMQRLSRARRKLADCIRKQEQQ